MCAFFRMKKNWIVQKHIFPSNRFLSKAIKSIVLQTLVNACVTFCINFRSIQQHCKYIFYCTNWKKIPQCDHSAWYQNDHISRHIVDNVLNVKQPIFIKVKEFDLIFIANYFLRTWDENRNYEMFCFWSENHVPFSRNDSKLR